MRVISHHHFKEETVKIDLTHFVDCHFEDCVLEYSGLPLTLERTRLKGCRYSFFGPAKATLDFLELTQALQSGCSDPESPSSLN